jgi:thioredoxin reductase
MVKVAVIGAGPYGLSIAAHLHARGLEHRIFGNAMDTWLTQMPKGMMLKSDGFATNLFDRGSAFTLQHYCEERGIPYADLGLPPRLEVFSAYGLAFQKRFVPHLEDREVISIEVEDDAHVLRLGNETTCRARFVIVAVGMRYFAHMPPAVAHLPKSLVTHSSHHSDLSHFRGKKVAVIGAGSSAADIAGILHSVGADAHLIVRGAGMRIDTKMRLPRPWHERLRRPSSVIGPGWRSRVLTDAPLVFYHLPEKTRHYILNNFLGPAAGYFTRDMVIGRVTFHLGLETVGATEKNGGVELTLANNGGEERRFFADHVIYATGYKNDLSRLPFLSPGLRSEIRLVAGTPLLSTNFESSVRGLYFVGNVAAYHFGPILRFACGAKFAARRLSSHLD